MMAGQVKSRIPKDLTPEEKGGIWKLIPAEHREIFKKFCDLADKLHSQAYPVQDEPNDIIARIKARQAKETHESNIND
jgi:hypothetical protein